MYESWQISRSPHDSTSTIDYQTEKPKRPSFHTGKWWYPYPWNRYPSCWTPQGAFQKGDIPNKYALYYKVYMGLIIRGTTPRGPHHLPYDHLTSTLNDPFLNPTFISSQEKSSSAEAKHTARQSRCTVLYLKIQGFQHLVSQNQAPKLQKIYTTWKVDG